MRLAWPFYAFLLVRQLVKDCQITGAEANNMDTWSVDKN